MKNNDYLFNLGFTKYLIFKPVFKNIRYINEQYSIIIISYMYILE